MTYRTGRLDDRGISVRFFRGGSGPSVLFLHGAAGMPAWSPFFEDLSKRYELLVPEHPCFGRSDDLSWIRHVPDLAMYYLDVLDARYASPVHVIGHCLGGWIAAEAATRNHHRFASLTLLAPAGIRVRGIPPGDNFMWSPEEAVRNSFYDQGFADTLLDGPSLTDEQVDERLHNQFAAAKFGWEPRWFDPDLEKWLHRISVPTHVIWGAQDNILPSAYARLWTERVPNGHVTIIDGCGHHPHVEKAGVVADEVTTFLDRVSP